MLKTSAITAIGGSDVDLEREEDGLNQYLWSPLSYREASFYNDLHQRALQHCAQGVDLALSRQLQPATAYKPLGGAADLIRIGR